ncbi:MAG: GNAT family N-acetyltransferase [Erysipelotrichaceae bacterium]|nr:GNAT family N-acetyltransferase [Erysipelotrichaceae bacterium]
MQDILIREIRKEDDPAVEKIIRDCLIEYGADHEGTAWADPDLCRFSEIYGREDRRYWVAEVDGTVVAGVGIGPLEGEICELQKMYCRKEYRSQGISGRLLNTALQFARLHYAGCYLETLPNMTEAQRFYEAHGFRRTEKICGNTGHTACDVRYLLSFRTEGKNGTILPEIQ